MEPSKPRRRRLPLLLAVSVLLTVIPTYVALASHAEASLPGSNFEIDLDANLKLDDPAPSIDWASVTEVRGVDAPTGQNDDSYKGGVKEDTECPGEVTGSIPNNKSDLLTFHVYEEPGQPGFMHLAWSRVSDPSGTTLMDFEFNQGSTPCAQGPNIQRTEGDLLIEYAIDQGGARAEITGRVWNGTAWGGPIDLDDGTECDGQPCATGTINQTAIPAADSDGLGLKQARTFGEATIDLDLIFDEGECGAIGNAMLKSRSSDAFTSQLKDFIRPQAVDIQNCAQVIIRKQTDPDGATELFNFDKSFATDPATDNTFDLADDGVQDYGPTVLFGEDLTVTEDLAALPDDWGFVGVDCSASTGVTPTITDALVTFDLDSADDVLDCTYTNEFLAGAIEISKTRKHAADGPGDHPHVGVTFTVTGGDLPAEGVEVTTDADGLACLDGLAQDDYVVTETVPSGYVADGTGTANVTVDNPATCEDGLGESVSFGNTPLTNITVSVDSQVPGGTASTISCVDAAAVELGAGSTDANGDGSVTVEDLEPTAPGATLICTIVVDP